MWQHLLVYRREIFNIRGTRCSTLLAICIGLVAPTDNNHKVTYFNLCSVFDYKQGLIQRFLIALFC